MSIKFFQMLLHGFLTPPAKQIIDGRKNTRLTSKIWGVGPSHQAYQGGITEACPEQKLQWMVRMWSPQRVGCRRSRQ